MLLGPDDAVRRGIAQLCYRFLLHIHLLAIDAHAGLVRPGRKHWMSLMRASWDATCYSAHRINYTMIWMLDWGRCSLIP